MNEKDILDKFKSEFPEFMITSDSAYYRLAEFILRSGQFILPYVLGPFIMDKVKENVGHAIADLIDCDCCLEFRVLKLDQKSLDIIFDGIRDWKQNFDITLRSNNTIRAEDQVIIMHPDIDNISAPELLRDCTSIIGKSGSYRLGIINTSTWDFSNLKFIDRLIENSEDCFYIEEMDDKVDLYEELEGVGLEREYEKLINQRPELAKAKVYTTDWD